MGAFGADTEGVLRAAGFGAVDVSVVAHAWEAARGNEVGDAVSADCDGAMNVVEVELRSRTRLRFEGEAALQAMAQLVARVK